MLRDMIWYDRIRSYNRMKQFTVEDFNTVRDRGSIVGQSQVESSAVEKDNRMGQKNNQHKNLMKLRRIQWSFHVCVDE